MTRPLLIENARVIDPASAYFCKHPRTQMTDDLAQIEVERFIKAA